MIARFIDWLLGDKCLRGTRGCWGRCERCIMARIAEKKAQSAVQSEAFFIGDAVEFHPHVDTSVRPIPEHDPATCWWCQNKVPRQAMERSGMEFSEKHT